MKLDKAWAIRQREEADQTAREEAQQREDYEDYERIQDIAELETLQARIAVLTKTSEPESFVECYRHHGNQPHRHC